MNESRYNLRLGVLGLAIFVSMLGVGMVVPFLPIYASQMGATGVMLGVIFSAFSAARSLLMPYVGILSDRYGRKPFIVLGLCGSAAVALAMIAAATPWQLVLARTGHGVFAAMILPVSMALLADVTPTGREGRSFGSFNTALLLGLGVGPLVGGTIYDLMGVNANFIFWAALSLSSMVLVAIKIKEPPAAARKAAATGWHSHLRLIKDRMMLGVFLCRVGSAAAWGINIAFLPMLCLEKGVSNFEVGILLAANALTMTCMQKPAGRLADRWPRLVLAGGGQLCSGCIRGLMPFAPGFEELLIMVSLAGLCSGLAVPALTAITVDRGRGMGVAMGVTMAFFALAMSLGFSAGPVVGGALVDLVSIAGAFYLAGVLAMAGVGILTLAFARENRRA